MTTTAIAPFGAVTGLTERVNAAGKVVGQRVAFIQDAPAGDIRKALKTANPALKGKELTKEVDKVLRGDSTLQWATYEVMISAARSLGFVPVVGDLNKKGSKLTLKLERPEGAVDKETALQAAKTQLTDEELLAILEERKKAPAAGEQPAIEA